MMRLIYIIFIFLLISHSCSIVNNDKNSDELNFILTDHCKNITLESLKSFLNNEKQTTTNKDFLKYYVYRFIDDEQLVNFVKNESTKNSNMNIYTARHTP